MRMNKLIILVLMSIILITGVQAGFLAKIGEGVIDWFSVINKPTALSDFDNDENFYNNVNNFTGDLNILYYNITNPDGFYNSKGNLTTLLDSDYVQIVGDTMTGNLVVPNITVGDRITL